MKEYIENKWRGIGIVVLGIGAFFVYAWFPYTTATTSFYDCTPRTDAEITQTDADDIYNNASSELCRRYGDPTRVYKFNSPDETLNYYWTLRLASLAQGKPSEQPFDGAQDDILHSEDKQGDILDTKFDKHPLYYLEPLEEVGNSLIRPRSVTVIDNRVMPGSFIGMNLLYGSLAQVPVPGLSVELIILLLTPLFAVIGIMFFYLLVAQVFDKNIAFISAVLAYLFPGWMYLASRSMYHNVLFVALLIIGVYLLVRTFVLPDDPENKMDLVKWGWFRLRKLILFGLSGLFIGGALITRTSEIGWVALVILLIFIFNWRRVIPRDRHHATGLFGLVMFAVGVVTAFIPVFLTNIQLYGAPLSIGYSTGLEGSVSGIIGRPQLLFEMLVSPFGIDLRSIVINGYNYLVHFFWYITIPSLLGILLFIISKFTAYSLQLTANKKSLCYLIIWLLVTGYSLLFYGSWQISDRIDEQAVSIGTSFVRYWLPVYLGMLPFAALLLIWITRVTRRVWARPVIIGLLIILTMVPTSRVVFTDTDESLVTIQSTLRDTQAKTLKLQELVPKDAIVILGFKQADKAFFPEHTRIIPELVVARDYEAVARLSQYTDLYYYHFAPQDTVEFISRRDFEPYGLRIVNGQPVFRDESLYQLETIDN